MNKKTENALKTLIKRNGWIKRGGHPDAKLAETTTLLKAAGFRKKDFDHSMSPDGYQSRSSDSWTHPLGLTASLYSHYGAVKSENCFSFTMGVKEKEYK